MFNKHLPLLHGNVSILPEVRFFLPADAGNCAVQRRIFRNKRVYLPKNSCSWVASSPSQSSLRDASSPKVGALGSPRKVHLFAKASPFEERLPPAGGRCRAATKRGVCRGVSRDGEGEDVKVKIFSVPSSFMKKGFRKVRRPFGSPNKNTFFRC